MNKTKKRMGEWFRKLINLPFFKSMRTRLTASYLLLTLIPLAIITIFVFNISIQTLKHEVSAYVSNNLEQINKNIDNSFIQLTDVVGTIELNEEMQTILKKDAGRSTNEKLDDNTKAADIINDAAINFPSIEAIYVFSYNGEIYMLESGSSALVTDYNFTRTRWFNRMKQLNLRTLILPTYTQIDSINEGAPKKVFGYISEIKDIETGDEIGFIMAEVDIRIINELLQGVSTTGPSEFVIVDDNKKVVYHTQDEYISTQFRANYIGEILDRKNGKLINGSGENEEIVLYNTSALTEWTIMSIMSTDILFSRINRFELAIIYTLVFCLFSAIIIAILMSRLLTEPIAILRQRMKLAESGDFNQQIDVVGKDEIGELTLGFNHMIRRIKQLIERVYHTEIVRKEAELTALQAQINPHFLYNTLQIMDIMAEEKGAEEISGACQALAKVFRYSISKSNDCVSLGEELRHVKNYVHIQKLRLGEKLDVEYHVDEKLYKYEMIKLILQPLVENAILHGIGKSGKRCSIRIVAACQKDSLIITVEDNGVGMDSDKLLSVQQSLNILAGNPDSKNKEGGIALSNVNIRIKIHYGEKFGLSIRSKKYAGTKVTLILPAIEF